MKANKNTVLIGEKVILVPYQCNHIPVHKLESTDCHHDWKSGYLLNWTAEMSYMDTMDA